MIGRLRWFYFLSYAGVGIWQSYFAPYLRGLGFTGEQIGAVTFAQQLIAAPAALAWGMVADRLGSPSRALRVCASGAAVAILLFPLARTPFQMGAALMVAAVFGGGMVPLVDSATVETVRGGYARTRLFGSLGFVVSAPLIGLLLTWRGEKQADLMMPLTYVGCVAINALIAQSFARESAAVADRPHWREAVALLRDPRLLLLLAICMLHWGALAPYHLMFGLHVRDEGLPSSVAGVAMSLGVVAEVLALAVFPRLEQRFSLRALFAAAFSATALRWLLVSRAHGSLALIALQLLHGLSFGVWWGCAVEAMQRVVPPRLRATGQAVFYAVVFSAGNALGYALAGAGYDRFGSVAPLFTCAAAVELLPLLLLLVPLIPRRGRA